ncbi:Uncharacterized protein APZ42_025945 [Daphnia magna]|uniref:Uncharacterized protein n=1 Tax=Daphnia magna TaxID=35525 RepID=A0A164SLX8_9CRUS|nr:Uncharacterized protein APZ42_025945 [Daphnia magna]
MSFESSSKVLHEDMKELLTLYKDRQTGLTAATDNIPRTRNLMIPA